jgi:malonyl-CoA decarboxylase
LRETHAAEVKVDKAEPSGKTAESGPSAQKARIPRLFFRRIIRSLAEPESSVRAAQQVISICESLLSERGEVAGARLASEVLAAYQTFDSSALDRFFELLISRFSPDPARVARETEAYRADSSPTMLARLQAAVEPPRQELFRRLNLARGGIRVLIQLRRRLINTLEEHPDRSVIDADLVHLFRSWFNGGFLVLQRIDWCTSALVLERLIEFEAVHQIQGWSDLRRRLEADRRCYAFFHPALANEPLIFIEVALTRGMSAKVQPLLNPDSAVLDPSLADCAMFYSITNCQQGLRGVSFGNLLIKEVVEDLSRSLPRVRTFATLSPMPGFSKWLTTAFEGRPGYRMRAELEALISRIGEGHFPVDRSLVAPLRDELVRLGAYYLLHAKQRAAPLDPVARFHLANGARLERLNWMGDMSESGMRRSLGLMVNYEYRLAEVERNHDSYANDYRIVASRRVKRLAQQSLLASASRPRIPPL